MKFILELFVEHIPAHFQTDLKQYYITGYKKYVNIGECKIYCSSRRLIFIVEHEISRVKGEMIILKGPRADMSKDSIPVVKFYESTEKIQQIETKELYIENGYWHIKLQKRDMNLEEFLTSAFLRMFEEHLPENRMMWYEGQKQMFVRPVRNLFVMMNDRHVEMKAFNLQSVTYTKTNNYKTVQVTNTDEYCELLERENVLLDENQRIDYLRQYVMGCKKNYDVNGIDMNAECRTSKCMANENLMQNTDERVNPNECAAMNAYEQSCNEGMCADELKKNNECNARNMQDDESSNVDNCDGIPKTEEKNEKKCEVMCRNRSDVYGQNAVLDVKQKRLLDLVAHHDEIIYPFGITIDYEKYAYMNEIPMDFLYASFDDQMQTMPVYGERLNTHDEYRVHELIFSSNIPVTEKIAQSTFKVCMSYIADVYALYKADMDREFNPEELRSLPTYKMGSMYDRMERLVCMMELQKNVNVERCKESVRWLNVDLLSKTVQEFPKLHGVCGAFVLKNKINNDVLRVLYNYYVCATERDMAVKRLFGLDGYFGYEKKEYACEKNAEIIAEREVVDWMKLLKCKCEKNDEVYAGMMIYLADTLDILTGFYIADGDQKIGSKDPFGLKSMIYNVKYIGLMLYIYGEKHEERFIDLREMIIFVYDQYERQKLCKLDKEKVIDNIMRIFTADMKKYINNDKSYWEQMINVIEIDEIVRDRYADFELICKVYKRIVNFDTQQEILTQDVYNKEDEVSVQMQSYVRFDVAMSDLIEISKELDKFFDVNRILNSEIKSRVYVLRELRRMYESYVCFDDKLMDVYKEKKLMDVFL